MIDFLLQNVIFSTTELTQARPADFYMLGHKIIGRFGAVGKCVSNAGGYAPALARRLCVMNFVVRIMNYCTKHDELCR